MGILVYSYGICMVHDGILGGSGDLVSRVISKVTILISTYNLN